LARWTEIDEKSLEVRLKTGKLLQALVSLLEPSKSLESE
jgi:hypothetical protein